MATIGKVSAVFSASTSGLKSGVNDAIRSFGQMGGAARDLSNSLSTLDKLGARGIEAIGPAADVAARRAAEFNSRLESLQVSLRDGTITGDQFAAEMLQLSAAINAAADSASRGAALTARYETEESKTARTVAELNALLADGTISQDVFTRAMADATGATERERREIELAARNMDMMAEVFRDGTAVTQSVRTAEERHADELQRLRGLLAAGAISQTTYGRAVDRADDELRQATAGTRGLGAATAAAGAGVQQLAGKLNTLIAINAAQLFGQVSAAVGNAVRSFVSMGAAQADVIGGQKDLASRLGMTYAELAGLGFAGAQVGVSMDSIGAAATKADVAFVKASQGSKQAQAAFEGIGLSLAELEGLSPAERFRVIAEAISALPTAAERSRAAIQIFGKAGAELIPMFENGAGAITAATEEAARFGLALTQDQSNAVDSMGDAFAKAQMAVQGIVGQVVAYLAPALEAVTNTFLELVGGIGGANIGSFIGEGIMTGAIYLAGVADWVIAGLGSTFEYAGVVSGIWNRVVAALQSVFFLGEAAFKGIASILARSASGWAMLLDSLPDAIAGTGWAEFGASMETAANELSAGAAAATGNAAEAAGRILTGEAGTPGPFQPGAGPLATMLANAQAQAERNRNATTVAEVAAPKEPPKAEPVFTGPSVEALKATDSRSKEGIAEMFRLMRGDGGDVQEQQLGVLEQIRDAVSEGDDLSVVDMVGA